MINCTRVNYVLVALAALTLALAGCSEPEAVAVATPLPTTDTAVPPAATATVVPPTATPTVTPIPPTATVAATATATAVPPTETPAPTPTREPLPGWFPDGISVTIDKDGECTVADPSDLPAGESTFVLRSPLDLLGPGSADPSGVSYELYINLLEDDTTYQDLLDRQGAPGRMVFTMDNLPRARITDQWTSYERDEIYKVFSLEEGQHLVFIIYRKISGPTFSQSAWYCAEKWVVAGPSE